MKKLLVLLVAMMAVCCFNGFAEIKYKKGDTISFGHYEQDNKKDNGTEPIEWIVLNTSGNKILVLSKYVLDCQPYNTKNVETSWENCSLRKWLNEQFISDAFTEYEAASIYEVVLQSVHEEPYKEYWFHQHLYSTNDKVFLLNCMEYTDYLNGHYETEGTEYANKAGAKDNILSKTATQWTRSIGKTAKEALLLNSGTNVYKDVRSLNVSNKHGIRPALWIDISNEHYQSSPQLYEEATKFLNKKQYKEAAGLFESLESYEDSKNLALSSWYAQAKEDMDAGNYENAIAIFEKLGDYEDSYALARECRYGYAEYFYKKGDYKEAAKLYDEVGQYRDSMDKMLECFSRMNVPVPVHYLDNENIQWYDTGVDKDYSGRKDKKEGMHKGWTLGRFFISGFTRKENADTDCPVFYKSLGDEVTLRFLLEQDIDRLNGEKDLSISDDTADFDEALMKDDFDKKQKFGRGTLLIRHTNSQNKSILSPLYTNYLLAKGTTGANTKVILYEEGKYEVALDYEVMKKVPVKNSFGNYSIRLKFEIRNGDMAVHFFDTGSKRELLDRDVTKDGFRISAISSNALEISVKYYTIRTEASGYTASNENYERTAKDGNEYKDRGIYVITVTDPRTHEHMQKTLFVGDAELRSQYESIR